ncbi:MAG: NAD(P)/FAD-dependent oxidoreductase [Candidatus Micrarchaeota archaeon]
MTNVIVVGAGPAGLFAAYQLRKHGVDVTVIELGRDINDRKCPRDHLGYCAKCTPCHVIQGVGGGGLFSDGKLNLNPEIGGNLLEFVTRTKANEYIDYMDKLFAEHGAEGGLTTPDKRAETMVRTAKIAGVRFIPIKQRHIGSDKLPKVISSLKKEMETKGVKFMLGQAVKSLTIEKGKVEGVTYDGKKMKADYVVLATGRGGARWLAEQCSKLGIAAKHQPIDIGVRVEVPAEIMEDVTSICYDPKFHINTPTYDDHVRTFCTNPHGFIISEQYGDYVCVNGHAMRDKKSENTNFAFLVRVALTEPQENTNVYGEAIARMATTIGGGKVVLQRLGDLKKGRRSSWERIEKSYVEPTFKDVTPGDIGMTLPGRIVTDILEGLDALSKVIPGVAEDSTLIYSPEIKFHALRVQVNKQMETSVKNLFAVGDGAGVSRGIVGAAVTGLIAADEIALRLKK